MTYRLTFTRNGSTRTELGSRAQVQALADYLQRTFRITSTLEVAS